MKALQSIFDHYKSIVQGELIHLRIHFRCPGCKAFHKIPSSNILNLSEDDLLSFECPRCKRSYQIKVKR